VAQWWVSLVVDVLIKRVQGAGSPRHIVPIPSGSCQRC
jgi:hypothetical protein